MSQSDLSGPLNITGVDTKTRPYQVSAAGWRMPGWLALTLTATTATTGGAVGVWQNPESVTIIIARVLVLVTTKSTGAATLNIGTTATNATTSSNNLLTALDVGTAAGLFDNITDVGASGKSRQSLASGKWVTFTGTADTTGLVATAYIEYFKA